MKVQMKLNEMSTLQLLIYCVAAISERLKGEMNIFGFQLLPAFNSGLSRALKMASGSEVRTDKLTGEMEYLLTQLSAQQHGADKLTTSVIQSRQLVTTADTPVE